jgi:hypothetical protein
LVVNEGTGEVASFTADNDGAIGGSLLASIQDRLLVTITEALGNVITCERGVWPQCELARGFAVGGLANAVGVPGVRLGESVRRAARPRAGRRSPDMRPAEDTRWPDLPLRH